MLRVKNPPAQTPLLVWDGDCSFCRLWIQRWSRDSSIDIEFIPSSELGTRYPEISRDQLKNAVCLIETDGRVSFGARAVLRFQSGGLISVLEFLQDHIPGVSALLEMSYRWIARHRPFSEKVTRLLWGRSVEKPTYEISSLLFVRMLGVVFAVAFISLWVQIEGLIGDHGILPAGEFLEAVKDQIGIERYLLLPTWGWLGASNTFLNLYCATGTAFSILLTFGVAPRWCLLALWSLYLSLAGLCQVFLSFQWDVLLLEVSVLAIFLWPGHRIKRNSTGHKYSNIGRAILVYLLARLMFQSGMVKLASGDVTWWSMSALDYHYWTQPLPTWIGMWVHGLPSYVGQMSVAVMFAVELVLPFLVFAPRRLRATAAIGFILFQGLIAITGNYGFFNLLTVVLCLLLVDDRMWPEVVQTRLCRDARTKPLKTPRGRWAKVGYGVAMVYVAITLIETGSMMGWRSPEQWIRPLTRQLSSFRSINRYGLFASMTTRRPEILIEGSMDGDVWQGYEFNYKPGKLTRAPAILPGHMPRLDWQLWFAALGDYRSNRWFVRTLECLLEGKQDVLDLLESNPFPDTTPRLIRAVVYEYRPATAEQRRATGVWWTREFKGLYCPVLEAP